jgi:predicted acylesterase/phospholipase RssA
MSVSDGASVSTGEATGNCVTPGLSLGGGATRGLLHIGYLEVLERKGLALYTV